MLPTVELRTLAYGLLGNITYICFYLFNLIQFNKKKHFLSNGAKICLKFFDERKEKNIFFKFLSYSSVWAVVELVLFSVVQSESIGIFNYGFGDLLMTGANYFGLLFFVPFVLLLLCLVIRVDPRKQIDLITPTFPLALIFAKIGCFGAGCCNGCEWSTGFYNYATGHKEIPLQLVEAGVALLLFVFLLIWRKKAKAGTMFPIYMIAYSAIRFFTEFLSNRDDIIGPFNIYHILCFAGVIIGIVELLLVLEYGEKLQKFFTETPYGYFIKAIKDKIKQKPEKKKAKSKK